MPSIRNCPLIALILFVVTQSIAQENRADSPDEFQQRMNQAMEDGFELAEKWNREHEKRKQTQKEMLIVGFAILLVVIAGTCVMLRYVMKKKNTAYQRIVKRAESSNLLDEATRLLQERLKCPWCREAISLDQARCNNCRLEIGWYEQIPCEPGKENECKHVWAQHQALISSGRDLVKKAK